MDNKILFNRIFGDLLEHICKYGEVIFSAETKNEDPEKLTINRQATVILISEAKRISFYLQIEIIVDEWCFVIYCKRDDVGETSEVIREKLGTESIEDEIENAKKILDTYLI